MSQPQPLPTPLRIARIFHYVFLFGYIILTIFNMSVLSKENRFKQLESIAIDSQDNIYIAQAGNSTIVKYDSQGKTLLTWGSTGSADGQIGGTFGLGKLAIGPHDDIYVIDKSRYRVLKFDQNGNFLAKWGSKEIEPGKFGSLENITVDNQDQVYIWNGKVVQKFDSRGNFLGILGDGLPDKDELNGEHNLAADHAGNVYMYSINLRKIFKFDSKGQLVERLAIQGVDPEHFNNFGYMSFDRQDNIYLMDLNNDLIFKIDSTGNVISRWTFNDKAHLSYPYMGTALDSQNNYYLLNREEDRVEVLGSNGQPLEPFSIGWPKWIRDSYYPVSLVLLLMNVAIFIFETSYRKKHNLPLGSKNSGPVMAPSLVGKVSQLLTFLASFAGFLISLVYAALSSTEPSSIFFFNTPHFISISPEINSSIVGWPVVIVFIVLLTFVFVVPKRPIKAGILQMAGGGLIYFLSLDQNLKLVAIVIAIGGILAIASSIHKKAQMPHIN